MLLFDILATFRDTVSDILSEIVQIYLFRESDFDWKTDKLQKIGNVTRCLILKLDFLLPIEISRKIKVPAKH
jgi:hypothetical protein